jgi:hypothetical protein
VFACAPSTSANIEGKLDSLNSKRPGHLARPGFLFLSSGLLRRIQGDRGIVTSQRLDPPPESMN